MALTGSSRVIDTARLTLRPLTKEQHATVHGLFTQPGMRRFLFDNEILPPERTAEILGKSEALSDAHGLGLWLALARSGTWSANAAAEPIGFGGFWYFREPPELELLYGVADNHVKQGYGREIARAIVHYGFSTLAMTEIRASTDEPHHDSRRLLEEIGFSLSGRGMVNGLDTVFYAKRQG
jgi:[ribosomal protein S5]-alanine N-acetyltransferase